MIKPLPHGWSETYTIRHLLYENEQLQKKIAALQIAVARLDAEKQSKRGPKPKPIAQGNARSGETL